MHTKLVTLFFCLALSSCSPWNEPEASDATTQPPKAALPSTTDAPAGNPADAGSGKSATQEDWKILAAEAFASGGILKCGNAGTHSWSCAAEFRKLEATYGFNPSACSKIPDRETAAECRSVADAYVESFATEFSQCRKITNVEWRTRCSDKVSLAKASSGDPSACESLRTVEMKDSCRDGQYLRMAQSWTGWTLVCRKISNSSVREACERARFEISKN